MVRPVVEFLEDRRLLASTHFAVIGDFGQPASGGEAPVAAMVHSWNPDFVVTVGDNSYPNDADPTKLDDNIGQFYSDYIYHYHGRYGAGSPTPRFYPTLGNHDWGDTVPGDASGYFNYFDLPGNERYYDFTAGPVHFFIIDSDANEPDGNNANSTQALWLKGKLAAATEPQKLVFFHHPAYSSGSAHGSTLSMRWPFAKWGATAVFSGHEHDYERLNEEGIPYFVDGLGGASISSFATPIAGSQVRYAADFGAMLVDADQTSIQYKFYSKNGVLVDSYTRDFNILQTLVPAGSVWKYKDDGQDHGTAWRTTAQNDNTWASGAAQLGYGDGDEATTINFGPNSSSKYITTYFARKFTVSNLSDITGVNLNLLRDDGAVVYLNGTEVYRNNMPTGTINYLTLSSTSIGGDDEGNWYSTALPASVLQSGENLLAVEIHQTSGTSSDIGFDLALQVTGDFTAPAVISADFRYNGAPMSLQFSFSKDVRNSLSTQSLLLQNLTTSSAISVDDMQLDWIPGTNTAVFTFPSLPDGGSLPSGRYHATLQAGALPISADYPVDFYILAGDANHDAVVDIRDLAALASHWQLASNLQYQFGDFNYDGVVDSNDLGILSSHWQSSLPPLTSLSAPSRKAPSRTAAKSTQADVSTLIDSR